MEFDPPTARPFAAIDVAVTMSHDLERAFATTDFRPPTASNERVAELGLWTLWDYFSGWHARERGPQDLYFRILDKTCAYYREHGMPQLLTLGTAPFEAYFKADIDQKISERRATRL